jgi:hypothetical protein
MSRTREEFIFNINIPRNQLDDFDLNDVSEEEVTAPLGSIANDALNLHLQLKSNSHYHFRRLYADRSNNQCFFVCIVQAMREKLLVTTQDIKDLKNSCLQNLDQNLDQRFPHIDISLREEITRTLNPDSSLPTDHTTIQYICELLDLNLIALRSHTILEEDSRIEVQSPEYEQEREIERTFELSFQLYSSLKLFRKTVLLYHKTYLDRNTNSQEGHYELLALVNLENRTIRATFDFPDPDVHILSLLRDLSQNHAIVFHESRITSSY